MAQRETKFNVVVVSLIAVLLLVGSIGAYQQSLLLSYLNPSNASTLTRTSTVIAVGMTTSTETETVTSTLTSTVRVSSTTTYTVTGSSTLSNPGSPCVADLTSSPGTATLTLEPAYYSGSQTFIINGTVLPPPTEGAVNISVVNPNDVQVYGTSASWNMVGGEYLVYVTFGSPNPTLWVFGTYMVNVSFGGASCTTTIQWPQGSGAQGQYQLFEGNGTIGADISSATGPRNYVGTPSGYSDLGLAYMVAKQFANQDHQSIIIVIASSGTIIGVVSPG